MALADIFRRRKQSAAFNANAYISASMGYVPLVSSLGVKPKPTVVVPPPAPEPAPPEGA